MSEWNDKQLGGKVRNNTKSMDPAVGTTTNVVTSVVDLDTRQMCDTEFIIANTGSNTLYYSVRVRSEYETEPDFTVFSNSVVGGSEDEVILVRHARIYVYINSHVSDQHTTYKISAIGGT